MIDSFLKKTKNQIKKEAGTMPDLNINIHRCHKEPIPIEQAHRITERIGKKYGIKGKQTLSYYPERDQRMEEWAVSKIGNKLNLFFKPKRRNKNV